MHKSASIAVLLLVVGFLTAGSFAQSADDTGEVEPSAEPFAEPPRPMTRAEAQRELEIVRRELEEMIERIGEAEPSDKQRARMLELTGRIAELREKLDSMDAEVEESLKEQDDSFNARWKRLHKSLNDVTNYDFKDGMFRFRVGVRLQVDATYSKESDQIIAEVGPVDNSVNGRRARIFAFGRIFRRFDFGFEYDFSADAGLKDAYLEGGKFLKYAKWRIGNFKEPFSLSRQTSGNDLGLMEWPLPVQAIAPGRNPGLMIRHDERHARFTWAVATTTNGSTTDDNRSNAKITVTGRMTGLPVYKDEGRRLVHLGLSYSARSPKGSETIIAARPEARFAPPFVSTGAVAAADVSLVAVELAAVRGTFWAQAEWIGSFVESRDAADHSFGGVYVETGWFLTGESRFYRTEGGTFGRLMPNRLFHGGNPFTGNGDGGAIEITGRYSTIDLSDGAVSGGEMRDFSLGLNWYLSQTTRFMINYIHSNVRDGGHADLVLLRFQFNP